MGAHGSKPLLCRGDDLICRRRHKANDWDRNSDNRKNKKKNRNSKHDGAPKFPLSNDQNDVAGGRMHSNSSIFSTYENSPKPPLGKPGSNPKSFHEGLVRERDRQVDFDEIYQVLNEIGNGGLCKIYRVQKYENKIGGSSRPEGVRKKKFQRYYGYGYGHGSGSNNNNNSSSNHGIGSHNNIGGSGRVVRNGVATDSFRSSYNSNANLTNGDHKIENGTSPAATASNETAEKNNGMARAISSPSLLLPLHRQDDVPSSPQHNGAPSPSPKQLELSQQQATSQPVAVPAIPSPAGFRGRSHTEPGNFGTSFQSMDRSSSSVTPEPKGPNMYFALKVINLAMVDKDKIGQLKNEVEILKTLDHKNIIKAYETFQMRKHKKLMIVMELCSGGDMHARMPYTERQVANAMRQVLSAISYMHSKRIIHRDIKLENILWESEHPEAVIKVIDFGLSKVFSPNNNVLTERVGTLYSMSPETMKGIYTTQADLWSIGVCTYIMLSMNRPFEGQTPKQLVANVLQCNYKFVTTPPQQASSEVSTTEQQPDQDIRTDVWTTISDHAKSFISQLLVLEPLDRLTADTAKNHEWFQVSLRRRPASSDDSVATATNGQSIPDPITATESDGKSNKNYHAAGSFRREDSLDYDYDDLPSLTTEEFKNKVRESIVQYADMGEFRRLALNVVAKKSTSSEIFELRKVFDEFDTLNTGTLTLDEFKAALSQFQYSEKEIMKIFRKIDVNKNNVINYTEFLAATLQAQGAIEEYRLAEAFDVLDSDDSGFISRENLKKLLGDRARDEKYLDRLIAEADFAKDGKISYEEFLQVFNRTQHDAIHDMYMMEAASNVEQEIAADEVLQKHGIIEQQEQRPKRSSETNKGENSQSPGLHVNFSSTIDDRKEQKVDRPTSETRDAFFLGDEVDDEQLTFLQESENSHGEVPITGFCFRPLTGLTKPHAWVSSNEKESEDNDRKSDSDQPKSTEEQQSSQRNPELPSGSGKSLGNGCF